MGEEDRLIGAVDRPPVGDSPLEGSPRRVLEPAGVPPLQIVEKRLGFQPGFALKHRFDLIPNLGEGIGSGSVVAGRFSL